MKVLVCGGRTFGNARLVNATLSAIHQQEWIDLIIQGGARGVDALAIAWAIANDVGFHTYWAEWEAEGRAAGPRRNATMLAEGKPDLVVAFPGGVGTANMIAQAKRAGVAVRRIE